MNAKAVKHEPRWLDAIPRVGRTALTVPELIDYLVARRDIQGLFRMFPDLQPEDVRDAVEYAARNGYLA